MRMDIQTYFEFHGVKVLDISIVPHFLRITYQVTFPTKDMLDKALDLMKLPNCPFVKLESDMRTMTIYRKETSNA